MPLVSSSNIQEVSYDDSAHRLVVTFVSGSTYEYPNATERLYQEFLDAPSKGRFLRSNVIPMLGRGVKLA